MPMQDLQDLCENADSIVSFNDLWDFSYTSQVNGMENPAIPPAESFSSKMPVPGYWDDETDRLLDSSFHADIVYNPDYMPIKFPPKGNMPPDGSLPYIKGVGWYRKIFEAPVHKKSQQVNLTIGGVRLEAWVWINGTLVKYHLGHSTAFEVPLTGKILSGRKNELIIAVSNVREDRSGCDLRGYHGKSGGIYRPVHMTISGPLRIADLYLQYQRNEKRLQWMAEFQGNANLKGCVLNWRVITVDTGEVLKKGECQISGDRLTWYTDTDDMQEWTEQDPRLYDIQLNLKKGNERLDSYQQIFGMRTIERSGTSLLFNGQPIMLRGVTEHCHFPLTCAPPFEIETYRENIKRMKELGFNWIRFHTWVPPEEYLRAADELGVLIQVEPPVGFDAEEWINILRACRNHPSVIIYCCGNEELLDEKKIEELWQYSILCREYVPDALFCPQSAMRGIEYKWNEDMGDDVISKPFTHNQGRLNTIRKFSDVFGQYSWGYLSYASIFSNLNGLDKRHAIYGRPCLAHEIGIHGSYLDLELEKRYEGSRIGAELYTNSREYLEKMGVLHKARIYYENSCKWQSLLRKQTIETTRKCQYMAGYDFLGPIDQHWHRSGYPCGIMNEFYELKPGETKNNILKYNNESVLLLDHCNKRNIVTGDEFKKDILLSYYGREPIRVAELEWSLLDDKGNSLVAGRQIVENVTSGLVTNIGSIQLAVPALKDPTKVILSVQLKGQNLNLDNNWNYWIFPRTDIENDYSQINDAIHIKNIKVINNNAPAGKNIKMATSLDEGTIDSLAQGATIMLIGCEPLPVLPTTFQQAIAGRVYGNLATIVEKHPAIKTFPHEGFCDWQFYAMLEGGNAVVFNHLDIPFNPIVEIASTFKLIRKQALLFELMVGRGKLLVCTLNLFANDPAAKYMLKSLLDYITSDEFHPKDTVSSKDIRELVRRKYEPLETLGTDQAFDPNAQL
jgi:beta-galactosidase